MVSSALAGTRGIARAAFMVALIPLLLMACAPRAPRRSAAPVITGTTKFKEQVASALALLKTKSPEAYGIVTNYVGEIKEGTHSGMWAYWRTPTFELNGRTAFYSVTWCAGSIAHDSFHSKLYHDYRKQGPGARRVPEEIWMGEQAEKRCSEHQLRVLQQIGAPPLERDWLRQTNHYWEVDYKKRDW